jgi:hypothetical protein
MTVGDKTSGFLCQWNNVVSEIVNESSKDLTR